MNGHDVVVPPLRNRGHWIYSREEKDEESFYNLHTHMMVSSLLSHIKLFSQNPEATMVEEREELLLSPTSGYTTRRKGHFLKPFVNETVSNLLAPSLSLPSPNFDPQKWRLKVGFMGWRNPEKDWTKWVDSLLPQYQSLWKKAGIFEAILSSTHEIRRSDDLFYEIVARWCPETKTFVFVWGEATITLEDVMVLGGFSVIGEALSLPLITTEMKKLEERLAMAMKLNDNEEPSKVWQDYWIKTFMGSGSDIEHEAFLVLWLSRFVFPYSLGFIRSSIFSIAIHLARGTRIALAPPVLAAIYSDLTVLKETIIDSLMFDDDDDDLLALNLWSPLLLVQLWAWERFPELQPVPNSLKEGDTRSARWDRVEGLEVDNVRSVLDSAGENFLWRPYTNVLHNWENHRFYTNHEGWVLIDSGLDEKLLSFIQCIKVCDLVGVGFVEQYHPHRVAVQFGFDQDLPCDIPQTNETHELVTKCYVPPRLFESDVTVMYLEWWSKSVLGQLHGTESRGALQRDMIEKRLISVESRLCNGHESPSQNSVGDDEDSSRRSHSPITREVARSETTSEGANESKMVRSERGKASISGGDDDEGANESKVVKSERGKVSINGDDDDDDDDEGANESKVVRSEQGKASVNGDDDDEEGSACKYQRTGLDLEDRVRKLEEIFAKLKRTRKLNG